MRPEFHPAAAEELTAAVQAYEERVLGLGRDLRLEAQRVTELLCITPNIGEPLGGEHRCFPLRRFPFGLIYRVSADTLLVVAVAHQRRIPGYWTQRT